jgi:enoyl-CoA hydratase/carnithine racemase
MPVRIDKQGPVAVLTLDRPDKRNAFDGALTAALDAALNAFEDDAALRVAVLTGGTRFFSAGTDVVAWAGEPRRAAAPTASPAGACKSPSSPPSRASPPAAASRSRCPAR